MDSSRPLGRRRYDRIARLYDLLDLPFERGRYKPLRRQLFQGVSGSILDAGVGTGRNMAFYPDGCRVVAIDLSPAMLARAEKRRIELGKAVELLEMDVADTSFPDRHFDTIIATFLFCVLEAQEQLPALRELARICKPTGQIRLLEYTYSQNPIRRLLMRLWAPWVRWVYGAAFDRHTERYVLEAGLEIIAVRFLYQDIIKMIVARPNRRSEQVGLHHCPPHVADRVPVQDFWGDAASAASNADRAIFQPRLQAPAQERASPWRLLPDIS